MNPTASARREGVRPFSILAKIAVTGATICAVRKLASHQLRGDKPPEDKIFRDKVVLITGGSRGLGLALAFAFGARGSRLALCARDGEELNEACRQLREKNYPAVPFIADIAQQSETGPLIDRVMQHFGRIDILVNNAGDIQVAPIESLTHEDLESAMQLMFWAPVNLTLAALPHMKQRHSGRIVNITSVGGRVSIPHLLPYSCAKFACVGFSTGLASELKSKGIHVLTVIPGLMRTGSYLNAKFGGHSKKEFTWFGLLGNAPGFSISTDEAASQVIVALEKKQLNVTISLPAKLLVASETLLPNTTRTVLSIVNSILPMGKKSSSLTPGKEMNPEMNSMFHAATALGKEAARTLNE